MPEVSILMPVYNAARYLREAVESIRAQTFREWELIAVDDGSKDDSRRILESLARSEPRMRVLSRPNTGIVGALNDGIALANGALLARMDADDVAEPGRLAAQVAFLAQNPSIIGCGTAVWFIDPRGAIVESYSPPFDVAAIEAELLRGNGGALIHPTLVVRAEAIRVAGGYAQEFCHVEDVDLYFRLLRQGPLANLPDRLLRYRQHPASTNFTHRERQRRLMRSILEREHSARGHRFLALQEAPSACDLSPAALCRRWACGAFRHGSRRTALRHALRALLLAPLEHSSWKTLKYVLGSPPMSKQTQSDRAGDRSNSGGTS
jgi:glycosyltransferase involved in cell wall biosynthesis